MTLLRIELVAGSVRAVCTTPAWPTGGVTDSPTETIPERLPGWTFSGRPDRRRLQGNRLPVRAARHNQHPENPRL
jgi:hypothetical protein